MTQYELNKKRINKCFSKYENTIDSYDYYCKYIEQRSIEDFVNDYEASKWIDADVDYPAEDVKVLLYIPDDSDKYIVGLYDYERMDYVDANGCPFIYLKVTKWKYINGPEGEE